MERVAPEGHVRPWSATLSTKPAAADSVPQASAPDPMELLERERLRVLEAARDEGYAAGMQRADDSIRKAVEDAEKRVTQLHAAAGERLVLAGDRFAELLQSLRDELSRAEEQLESIAIEVAFAATARVLGKAAVDHSLVVALCREVVAEYQQRPAILRVSADDVEVVAGQLRDEEVRVVADSRLVSGQCRLETHKGLYDTSLEVRLGAIQQALIAAVASGTKTA